MSPVELLKKLIAFKSLTPDSDGCTRFAAEYLDGFERIDANKNGVENIFLYKKFNNGPHLCFAGHIDVVPAGEGWNSDPFAALEKDGVIFGRGAADMKGGVAAFLYAAKNAKDFCGTLSVLLTSDEEGDAEFGTVYMLEKLKELDMLPDYCIVAEPTCEAVFGDTIKVGRRGSVNGVLTIRGRGGHAAYPEKAVNPITLLSRVLPKISDAKLDNGDQYFSASRLVVTDIKGGYGKHNVIPSEITVMFNVRNSTATSNFDIENFIKGVLSGEGIDNYELKISVGSKSFIIDSNNSSEQYFGLLSNIIAEESGINPKASTAGGTSDARFIAEYGIKVLEFGVRNETIHAPNECVEIAEIEKLTAIFQKLIGDFSLKI